MKKLTHWIIATVLIGSVLAFTARAADSPSVLLQKGIYAEETEGNVDAAIKIYEQIAAEAATNRTVIAQAQYRLAVCYQKKGNKEQAIKLLSDLLQQFPADASASKKARETLAELGVAPAEGVSIRRVPLAVAAGWFMSISKDGRLIAYQPNDTDDLAVCEIPTGKSWNIVKGTKDKNPWSDAMISPDGQWIAYDLSGAAIYVSKINGTEPRKLFERDAKKDADYTDVEGWSADSTQLTVGLWSKPDLTLVLGFDVRTGAKKEIARLPQVSKPDAWSFASDGRYMTRRSGSYPRIITLIDLKSGREERVVDHDAEDVVGWAPGDTKLLFTKNRGASMDLWAIGVKDGKTFGEPELLWSNQGKFACPGISRDGSIYYAVQKNKSEPDELWVMDGFLTKKTSVVETWKLQTEIPPEELLGPSNTMLDRKFGFSATLPEGWTIKSAARLGNGVTMIYFTAPEAQGVAARVNYRTFLSGEQLLPESGLDWMNGVGPKPTTPTEVDSWLRKFSQLRAEQFAKSVPDFKVRAGSLVTKSIGGHLAVVGLADYTTQDKPWVEYFTIIYSADVLPGFRLVAPAASIDAVRPAFERLIESVRIP